MRERKEHRKKVNLILALILGAFALITYLMTFVIAHLTRQP
jgi:hypothetical protein